MKTMKYLSVMLMMLVFGVCMAGCGDDDENEILDSASRIEGDYVGTLKPIGYTDEPARAYVTLTRRANDVVSFTCSCETFGINSNSINLTIEERNGSVMYLSSESSYAVEGTVSQKSLSITFSLGNAEWFFSGSKD